MKPCYHPVLVTVTCVLLSLCTFPKAWAQAPQGVHFQAVARDAQGVELANKALKVRFTLFDGAARTVYQEVHGLTTDVYGLMETTIGQGVPSRGTFAAIEWGEGPFTMEIEIDAGAGYFSLGTSPLESVPYALYAEKANMAVGDLSNVDLTGLAVGQGLQWDGTQWVPGTATANDTSVWEQNARTAFYNQGRVGIGIDTPMTTLHLPDTANVLWGKNLTGSGFKMIWYAAKGAMRMGYLTNPFGGYNYDKFWDYDSVGFYSFAGGQNSRAKGFGSFAFGSFGWADGSGSVAFFGNARGNNSFTFGGSSKGRGSITFEGTAEEEGGIAMYGYTGGRYGVSIGGGTTGLGASSSREDYAIAIGWNADARGQASIALGPSDAYGYNSFSTGWVTEARGNYASTFGYRTKAYPYASMALGRYNLISGDSAAWIGSDPIFIIGDGTADNTRSNSFLIQKNGQTAIGYNAPTGMLNVSSALGSLNNNGLDPTHAAILIGTATGGMAFDANQIEMVGNNDLYLNFNGTSDVRMVEGGGRVGIGKNPAARLEIEQTANAVGGGLRFNGLGTGNYWDVFYDPQRDLQFAYRGTARASVDANTGAYNQLSDRSVKTNIHLLGSVLPDLLRLQAKTYRYKGSGGQASIGFIAQEVQAIFPERVHQTGDHLSLAYDEFAVLAVKAVQEQQATIEAQNERLEQLEAQLTAQQAVLEALQARLEALESNH